MHPRQITTLSLIAGAVALCIVMSSCERGRGYDGAAAAARRSEAKSEEAAADARRDQEVADAKRGEAAADARRDQAVADAKQAEQTANQEHAWTSRENAPYLEWERATRRDHLDYTQRPAADQQAYWAWRDQHPA